MEKKENIKRKEMDQQHGYRHKEKCRKADQLRKQMVLLYRNNIPMRIDVLLLPDCNHGHLEASTVEGANLSHPENCILIERWDHVDSYIQPKCSNFIKTQTWHI
ncbi:hypothetical protein KUTeg_010883 [Tegillarca granosa]|uniref:Uncharacterized protein n=1 Tax=Tegillarca granosa TaxID=220873 RepID=A0ABQ9F2A0_TEGGR|nr:hypothetical protein KUTeg_010883 [Tegillarca granosa]